MNDKKIEMSEMSKEFENFALKLLEKNFKDQFGNIQSFFNIKKVEKTEFKISNEDIVKKDVIKEDKKEFPERITFFEDSGRLISTMNKNRNSKSDLKSVKKKVLTNDQLRNDVALQRLLEESELLKKGSNNSTFSLNPTGKQRYKIIEKRLKLLGGKNIKEKIPFKIRLGMEFKAKKRKEIANKRAKEAGIVQALPVSKPKIKHKRNHGLNEIRIGKYYKGMVILSKNDIKEVMSTPGSDGIIKFKGRSPLYS
ncbi:hypothetical protein PCK1_002226 [Pneumocystis canis]|nr:hypothetical protein PCK1_002226 [Pneumocystis canis]